MEANFCLRVKKQGVIAILFIIIVTLQTQIKNIPGLFFYFFNHKQKTKQKKEQTSIILRSLTVDNI